MQKLHNKPWGERSFVVNDPTGVHLYIYSLVQAEPEYQAIYNKYKK
ncbi:MAG: Glyoxalase/Bleomycin resistance protein/Dioxygenase superfamily protein [Anaerosporomusa subterranea]|nr:Glyoxalase/Bleomycin resistance protein/Dioxygenase superfamily protein [Anaerosporomusa subterranea]